MFTWGRPNPDCEKVREKHERGIKVGALDARAVSNISGGRGCAARAVRAEVLPRVAARAGGGVV